MDNWNSSEKCLNCGTELKGEYCHECGQQKKRGDSSVLGFILEYLQQCLYVGSADYGHQLAVVQQAWIPHQKVPFGKVYLTFTSA